ncbi:MAG: lectin like domain-containing protein [Agathobacter sp.]|nr:lectin like domain-containing protein [Agathobacter sp.]
MKRMINNNYIIRKNMKIKRKLVSALTIAVILFNSNNIAYSQNQQNTNTNVNSNAKQTYHYELDVPATPLVKTDDEIARNKVSAYSAIPTSYKTQNLPAIRDQSPYGTCWAFSSTTLAEISLMKKENTLIDLSELHLVNFTNRTVEDPLGGTNGDRNYLADDENMLNEGGNLILAMQSYSSWVGAASEAKFPYETAANVQSYGLDDKYAYDDVAHLKNAYIINLTEDRDAAKQMIMDNGALGVSYLDDSNCYNYSTNSYYYSAITDKQNHAVTIVGWDDNYSKNNFKETPVADGAWLIRNSWGGNGTTENECYKGYFWMSYYDKSLSEAAYSFEFVSDKKASTDEYYDNNYQYDGGVYPFGKENYAKAANIFTAKKGQESLKAICFGTENTCEHYTVKIYKNLTDANNPESGTLVCTTTGETTFEGMYTVTLSNPVSLKYADTFSVVIELTGEAGVSFLCEFPKTDSWFNTNTHAEKGQSFFYSSGWFDYGENTDRNIRIKAFTDTEKEEIIVPSEDSIGISVNTEEMVFTKENSQQNLSAKIYNIENGEIINYTTTFELSQEAIAAGYFVEKNPDGTYTISLDSTHNIPTRDYMLSIYAVDYTGAKTSIYKNIKLTAKKTDISSYNLSLNNFGNIYSGNEIKPAISVSNNQHILIQYIDYEAAYANNINAGQATVTVSGKGWYEGTISKTYNIEKANKSITVPAIYYSKTVGDETFSLGASTVAGENLSYISSNESVATVATNGTVTVVGEGTTVITISSPESANYNAASNVTVIIDVVDEPTTQLKVTKTIKVSKKSYSVAIGSKTFSLGAKTATGEKLKYTTSDKKVVTVSAVGKVTVKGIGTATITLTSPESAKYKAAKPVKVTITVTPKKASLSSIKNEKGKKLKVTWKKDTAVTGYEVYYSLKSNFKGAKKVTVTKNKTVSTTIKKLTKGKTYYVRVRAYKTVKGKKIYGAYSATKKVKITK